MAVPLELASEFQKVVDLAVEDDPHRLFLVGHGLVAAGQVDNGEAPETEPERAGEQVPFIIGASVGNGPSHHLEVRAMNWNLATEVVLSADSTHDRYSPFRSVACKDRLD